MKITNALTTGFHRSVRAWKGPLLVTLFLLLIISFFAIPLKEVLKTGFGSSMATEELLNGFNYDIVGDITENIGSITSLFSSGLFMMIFSGIVLYAFFSGGLFSYLRKNQKIFTVTEFLGGSAEYFWPFLAISLMIGLLIILTSLLLMAPIVMFRFITDTESNTVHLILIVSSAIVLALIISVCLLVADFARAHLVTIGKYPLFKALGYGFKMTFRNILSSVPMMFILILIQILFVCIVSMFIMKWQPVNNQRLFIMFLLFQILIFLRIFLRSFRYASVTSFMEEI